MKRFLLILLLIPLLVFAQESRVLPDNNQVVLSTTPSKLVGRNTSRQSTLVRNMDAAITVYFGYFSTVSSTTGTQLKAGEPMTIYSKQEIWFVAASGAPRISYATE